MPVMTEFDHIAQTIEFDVGIEDVPIRGAFESCPVLSKVDRERVLKTQDILSKNVWKQYTESWSHKLVYLIIDDSGSKTLIYVGRQEDKDKNTKDRLQQHIHGETAQTAENSELRNWKRAVVIRAKNGGKEFTIEDTKILEAMLKHRLERYSNVEMKTKQTSKSAQGKKIIDVELLGEFAELVIEYIGTQYDIGSRQYSWMSSSIVEDVSVTSLDGQVQIKKDIQVLADNGVLPHGSLLVASSKKYPAEAIITEEGLNIIGFGERDNLGNFMNKDKLNQDYMGLTPKGATRMIGNPNVNGWNFWRRESDGKSLADIWNDFVQQQEYEQSQDSKDKGLGKPSPEFVELVDRGFVKVGDSLFARKSKFAEAIVLPGGFIQVAKAKYEDNSSIPSNLLSDLKKVSLNFACTMIGKLRGQKAEYNAWHYWHYETENSELVQLSELRDRYLLE